MVIDCARFPLVWMQIGTAGINTGDEGFVAFEALLARAEPFVLLDEQRADPPAQQHSQDEQKQLALWMNRHKSALRAYVKGQIHIEPDASKQQAATLFAVKFEYFWGYPLFVVASREEGVELAQKLLAQ